MKLSDVAEIGTNMEDADFWLIRRGSPNKIGRPVREFWPEHIGVRVTQEGRKTVLPDYLFYALDYLYSTGTWKRVCYGALALQHIRTADVKDVPLVPRG